MKVNCMVAFAKLIQIFAASQSINIDRLFGCRGLIELDLNVAGIRLPLTIRDDFLRAYFCGLNQVRKLHQILDHKLLSALVPCGYPCFDR